ncbi:hypothetical protein L6D11_18835, partial [Staphylococcus aureus]|nr:hypothetical protein [Staphylococcus aureus]
VKNQVLKKHVVLHNSQNVNAGIVANLFAYKFCMQIALAICVQLKCLKHFSISRSAFCMQ